MNDFKFVGHVYLYVKVTMKDGDVACSSADFDFSKPLTEDFFKSLSKHFFDMYSGLGFSPISVDYISEEEYDKFNCDNSMGTCTVSWDHDKTYVNGDLIES